MKLKIDFSFGVQYRGDGSALLGHEQIRGIREICRRAVDLFGGYTGFDTHNARRDPDAKTTEQETGGTISVVVDDWNLKLDENISAMVQQIKGSLQQKEVAVTRTEVQFDIL